MKKKIILVVILVISILWTNIAIALAATKTELQNQQSEINNKIEETEKQIEQVEEEI